MKSNLKKLKNCKSVLEIEVPKEAVQEKFEEVYREISKTASVPGFRVGKVPRDLLEQRFGEIAKEEVLKRIIPESYEQALAQYKLQPLGLPEFSDVHIEKENPLSFKAKLETRPEFDVKNYNLLKLKKKALQLKEEDVSRALDSLREANVRYVPKEGSDEKEKVLPELNDEFAKDLGFNCFSELKASIQSSLEQRLKREIDSDLELQIIDQLVKANSFEVPESLVKEEAERLLKDAQARIKYLETLEKDKNKKGFEFSEKDLEELKERAKEQALKQVKAFFIIDKIAQKQNIYLTREELDKRIEEIASSSGKGVEETREYLKTRHLLDEMAVNMRNAKVMEFLVKEGNHVSSNSS